VAEVSEMDAVRRARAQYEEARKRERFFLATCPPPNARR
jgi:hypothetical protein